MEISNTEKKQTHSQSGIEISIVVPLYEESQSVEELVNRIHEVLGEGSYEVILVDDGSKDNTWDEIKRLRAQYRWIHGIRLQRNYGKSTALQAGFDNVRGRYVVTMDGDLQDDPAEIPEMIGMLRENGSDLVSGWKKHRNDPITKTIPSRFFNFVTRMVTGIRLHDFNCGLKAYRRDVIEHIHLHGELHRYVPLLANWEGFDRIAEKEVTHHARKYGKTKFGLSRFMHGFLDLLTLIFVHNYMSRPMHLFGSIGVLSLVVGGGINLYMAYIKIIHDQALADRPLLYLGILLMIVGAQFFSIGFFGDMINRRQRKREQPNIRDRI
ncbi:MAG: glycosyltransferase family 2 protein [Balneolaceae bacterium]